MEQVLVVQLAETVTQINGLSTGTSITASTSNNSNPSASGTAYGLVGGYTNFSAIINGGSGNTTVNFTTNAFGQVLMDSSCYSRRHGN